MNRRNLSCLCQLVLISSSNTSSSKVFTTLTSLMPLCHVAQIPADMVVNSVIAAMVAHRNRSSPTTVYNISSSRRSQLKSADIIEFFVDYFTKNPWIDERGKPVKVKKFHLLDSMASLHKYFVKGLLKVCFH